MTVAGRSNAGDLPIGANALKRTFLLFFIDDYPRANAVGRIFPIPTDSP